MVLLQQLLAPNQGAPQAVEDEALEEHPATGGEGLGCLSSCLRHTPIMDAMDTKQQMWVSGEGERFEGCF